MATESDTTGDIPLAGPTPAPKPHPYVAAAFKGLERAIGWVFAQLCKPKPRTVVVGLILVIVGAFFIDHSVWTFPLVIIGAVMIISAWVGSRLEGRFGIEWSDGGARFELSAGFKSRTPQLGAGPMSQTTTFAASPVVSTPSSTQPTASRDVHDDVIEGEAHTIEIDVDELKALVAAAERANTSATATTNGAHVSWQETPARGEAGVDESFES